MRVISDLNLWDDYVILKIDISKLNELDNLFAAELHDEETYDLYLQSTLVFILHELIEREAE